MSRLRLVRVFFGLAGILTILMATTLPVHSEAAHEAWALAILGTVLVLQAVAAVVAPSRRLGARVFLYVLGALGIAVVAMHAGQLAQGSTHGPPELSLALAIGVGASMAIGAGLRFLAPAGS